MTKFRMRYMVKKASSSNIIFSLFLAILIPVTSWGQNGHAKYGGTVLIGMKGDFDSFNELNASDSDALQVIQNMLFMSLTKLDEKLQFVPYLAKTWEFSGDRTQLTFHLRRDVYWTDGAPTTAEDVLFTYQVASNPQVAYPASSRFDLTEQVDLIDKFTIRFHFSKPYPDALHDTQIPILPKHVLGKSPAEKITESDFNRNPVGNGPFKLTEWKANERVVFQANLDYALGRPFLDRVVFLIIPDETALLTNLLTGELDMAPFLTPPGFKKARSQNSINTLRYEGHGFTFVGWNSARPIFTKQVRQALTYAIDKQEIIDTLLEGFAAPAQGPLLPFVWAYNKNLPPFPYDPNKSRSLLKEADWTDSDGDGILDKAGKKLEFSIKTNFGNQLRKDIAVMVQAQLKKVGIKVNVEILEWNLFIEQVFERKNFDAVILAWDVPFTVNPTDLWHSKAIGNGYNFVSYKNPRVDFLLEKGRSISKRELAEPVWHEFQKIIVDDSPYTFLFVPDELAALSQRIQGVKMDARGFLSSIERWWIPREHRNPKFAKQL